MQNTDTPERALDLLDQAVLMRLDPDPLVDIAADPLTDEPIVAGALGLNIRVYVRILGLLETAGSTLGLLGWSAPCRAGITRCSIPHDTFATVSTVVREADGLSRDGLYSEAALLLDTMLESETFSSTHKALARFVQSRANASCSSIAQRKR